MAFGHSTSAAVQWLRLDFVCLRDEYHVVCKSAEGDEFSTQEQRFVDLALYACSQLACRSPLPVRAL